MKDRKNSYSKEYAEFFEESYAFFCSEQNRPPQQFDKNMLVDEFQPPVYYTEICEDDCINEVFDINEVSFAKSVRQSDDSLHKQNFISKKLIGMNVFATKGDDLYVYFEPIWKKIKSIRREVNFYVNKICIENNLILSPKDIDNIYKMIDMSNDLYRVPEVHKDHICFRNGVYNFKTNSFGEFSPNYGFKTMINVAFEPSDYTETPYFDKYCANAFNGDPRYIKLLLEIIGVALMNTALKAFFLFCGETNTGKSVMLDFLQELIGLDNTENIPTLNYFSDKWSIGDIVDKKLCLCADNNNTVLESDAISTIKQIVSSDRVKVSRKYKDSYTDFVNPTIICASNYGLTIKNPDEEDALIRRLIVLPFLNSVPRERQILNLKNRLIDESSEIISKALKAYSELEERNFVFTEVADKMLFINNPNGYLVSNVSRFIAECCVNQPESIITSNELYTNYIKLCENINSNPLAKNIFSKEFNTLTHYEKVDKVKGTVLRGYKGVALK